MADQKATQNAPSHPVEVVGEGPGLSPEAVDDVLSGLEAGFATDPAGPGIAVVSGHGARLDVYSGHLRARDGEGWYRRERTWNRATNTLGRLVVDAGSGVISLGAIRWCKEAGVHLIVVDDDAEVILAPATGATDPRLVRLQAAPPAGLDVEVAALLLGAKLRGEAGVARSVFKLPEVADTITGLAEAMDDAQDVDALRQLEASAAAAYFEAWRGHSAATLRFVRSDVHRVPSHWATFDGRRSLLTNGNSNKKAAQPLNALLNLAFSLAAVEARLACEAVGLHPALGFVHADEPRRANLALDLLEPVRPAVERFILDLVAERSFSRKDFVERADGSIRIAPALVQEMAARMPMWAKVVAPYAEAVSHLVGKAVAGSWQARTPLSGRNQKAAQALVRARKSNARTLGQQSDPQRRAAARVATDTAATTLATCVDCGGLLTRSRHLRCPSCWEKTPGQAREARRRRGRAIASARASQEAWRAEHPGAVVDRADFLTTITPKLKALPLRAIMEAAGVSKATASSYRCGKSVPHPSYWPTLASLVGAEAAPFEGSSA